MRLWWNSIEHGVYKIIANKVAYYVENFGGSSLSFIIVH